MDTTTNPCDECATAYARRTMEQYADAFLDAGLRLVTLEDVLRTPPSGGSHFPLYTILALDKA